MMSNISTNKGFTLIEMLIALFVLSVGLLGVVSLQTVSIRSSQESSFDTKASILVNEMIENMRATPSGNLSAFESTSPNTAPSSTSCPNTGGVTPAEQTNCFYRRVMTELPDGKASIVNNSGSLTINISWDGGNSQQWTP